jgi:putative phosphoribosyl transferase
MKLYNSRPFKDRTDAGRQLAEELLKHRFEDPIVLGIPRGGVVVSVEVASLLGVEHGVVVARKLRSPYQPELAIGAITAKGISYVDEALASSVGVDARYLAQEKDRQSTRASRYEESFNSHRRPPVTDRDVIIVDDGVATGATAIAAIRSMHAEGARKVIFAVPVGPPRTLGLLRQEADEVICLRGDETFFAVGQYYRHFPPIEDHQVRRILHGRNPEPTGEGQHPAAGL